MEITKELKVVAVGAHAVGKTWYDLT